MIASSNKIFAVVVTYNRLPLLKKVLSALQLQTRPVNKIIIVNNNATDGTKKWLDSQTTITIITQENTGGAGGFATGMQYAFENGADWIWLMDDDVIPLPDCLEQLLNYHHLSACLYPVHLDTENQLLDEENWLDPVSCNIISQFNISYKNKKKIWFRNTGSFEGMLVTAALVEKIGFPDKRFFIVHDDLAYAYMASKCTNVAVVADAVMQKLPVDPKDNTAYRYLYYAHRNLWLLEEYTAKETSGFTNYRKRRIFLRFLYSMYTILKSNEYPNRLKALHTLYKAYSDYNAKKEGMTF